QSFWRTITVPAFVAERPGRTRIKIVAPMTGIIENINIIAGEAITPGRELFSIRLTHEDMVQAQTSFLKTLGAIDVEVKEIKRLKSVGVGIVAGKVLLEREYAKQKLNVDIEAQREALYLHGFSEKQVNYIVNKRKLLRTHQIFAPTTHERSGKSHAFGDIKLSTPTGEENRNLSKSSHSFIVQKLNVSQGDFVSAGDTLCILADYRELYIQGRAFEYDANELAKAYKNKWKVEAVLEDRDKKKKVIKNLSIAYLDNQIETDSRALHFYVDLPNKKTGDAVSNGHRFLTWKFKPGQRLQLRIPVQKWENKFVLPVEAVARAGAEHYIFAENGDHFDRKPVQVIYKDQLWAVIESNDGSVFEGKMIAMTGAHQMQTALKNKAGGGVDPHSGHNH
ncbi:Probable Co/Zn/Cd efflux system membrane fusion protein, partial [hydrothermal vent metagenome]